MARKLTENTPKMGHNGFDPAKVGDFIRRLNNLADGHELATAAMREDFSQIYDEAERAHIAPKLIKALYAKQRAALKRQRRMEKWDSGERADFEMIEAALGDFGSTPLGTAALDAAREAAE